MSFALLGQGVGEIPEMTGKKGVEIIFPVDYKVSSDFDSPKFSISSAPDFNKELQLDIGPKTIKKFSEILLDENIKNIFWNGPLGAFDHPTNKGYARGSVGIAQSLFNKCIRNKDFLVVIGEGILPLLFNNSIFPVFRKSF